MHSNVRVVAACAVLVLALLGEESSPGVSVIDVKGRPFTALPSSDGTGLFVSVEKAGLRRNEIAVYHRNGSTYVPGKTISIDGQPTGLALTPDGRTLLIADGDRYAALSAAAALKDEPLTVTSIEAGREPGAIEVVPSLDGQYAFFSNELSSSVGVVRVDFGKSGSAAPTLALIGFVSVDHLPVGLALSPDGARLYVTSEFASGRPMACGNKPLGTIDVIDVAKAESDPSHALLSSLGVGCDPVRVAVTSDGSTVWATLRGENRVAAYDAVKLVTDPGHALLARAAVGSAPVGLLLLEGGKRILVANSNRFDRYAENSTLSVIDAQAVLSGQSTVQGTIPTGAFPRELRESPLKDAIYLTNFNGGTVEIIPETALGSP